MNNAPAPRLVQEPTDVSGQLLRLRAGQEHAVIERVQETRLADPVSLLHQFGVHDGDLAGRAAETDKAQFEPEPEGFAESGVP
jgi:hypothetical protein